MPNLDVNPDFATSFTHYPSLVVHLILKFEEKLILRVNEGGQTAVNVPLVTQPNSIGAQVLNRVPKKCTIEHQGHSQASTFKIVFDYRELPIDPRTIVAARVEIYAGTVSAEDFSEGIQREVSPGVRKSILKTRTPEGRSLDGDMHMLGMVDKWTVDMGESSEVHLEGRDLRGLLLDSPLVTPRDMRHRGARHGAGAGTTPSAGTHPRSTPRQTSILSRLDCTQNIAALVIQILEEHDTIRRLPVPIDVICRAEDFEDGVIPSPGAGSHIPRHRRGASGRGSNAGGGAQNMNFWDLITRYCQPKDALVCRDDMTWAPIGEIKVGDRLLGFAREAAVGRAKNFRKFEPAVVQEVFVRKAPVVALHMESGRVVRCTPDHHWFTGRSEPGYDFAMPCVGRTMVRTFDAPTEPFDPDRDYKLGYARGILEGDGCYIDKTYTYKGKRSRTKFLLLALNDQGSLLRYAGYCSDLGLTPREGRRFNKGNSMPQNYIRMGTAKAIQMLVHDEEPESDSYTKGWLAGIFDAEGCTSNGLEICQGKTINPDVYEKIRSRLLRYNFDIREESEKVCVRGGISEMLRFYNLVQPAAVFKFQKKLFGKKLYGAKEKIVRIEECGEEEVVSLKTSTGTYFGQGYASRNCFLVGVIPSFVGRKLYLRPARALFTHIRHEYTDTPFRPNAVRSEPDGSDVWGIRRLVYGRDITTMKITRNYAGHIKPKTVRIVSVDRSAPVRGRAPARLMEALWPPRNLREARADGLTRNPREAIGGQESSEILNVPVYGVNNMAQLVSIAQSLYEQIGRGEIKGEVESAGLTSFGGSNADPDLIRLKVGDPVELLVDASALDQRSPIVATLNRTMQLPFSQAVAEIQQYLRDENLSRAIVASARGNVMGVLRYFRVSQVSLDWSDETMTVKADIQNYWTPRWDYVTSVGQTARHQQTNHADARHRPSPTAPPGAPIDLGTVSRVGRPAQNPTLVLSEGSGSAVERATTSTYQEFNPTNAARWR